MRYFFPLTSLVLGLIALSGCNDDAAQPPPSTDYRFGQLQFEPCTLDAPYTASIIQALCTTVPVPENPDAPTARTIELHVAWLTATSEGAGTDDPVLFLAGGPGQSASATWPMIDAAFSSIRNQRHIILVDQRGTGKSHPLSCPTELPDIVDDARSEPLSETVALTRHCLRTLDADPRFYTTTDAVRDLETVRQQLGVDQINLVGVSYGTRLAQHYTRQYPQHVRSLVLDGVVPNTLVLGTEEERNLDAALQAQYRLCQQHMTDCRERFPQSPDVQRQLLIERLSETPATVEFHDPATAESRQELLTADHIAALTRLFSYAPQSVSLLPLILEEAVQERYAPLMALSSMLETQMTAQLAQGMQLSVICTEDAPLFDTQSRGGMSPPAPTARLSIMRSLQAQCALWPHGTRPDDFHEPLHSDVPALLISGEIDPVTPPSYGETAVAHLSRGRHLVLTGQGHGNFNVGCMPKLLGQFVESADSMALDTSCLDALHYLPPFTTFNGWDP